MRTWILWLSLLAMPAHAATFTVTSVADSGGASCGANCTLRQALSAAFNNPGPDVIAFGIAGTGPHRITLTGTLPGASDVLVDGYTQPGSQPNTHPLTSNAILAITIDAGSLPTGQIALVIQGGAHLRGVVVIAPPSNVAVDLREGQVSGSWFNVEADGSTLTPQGSPLRLTGPLTLLGGPTPGERNVIASSNPNAAGIIVGNGQHTVQGNLIGLRPDGLTAGSLGRAIEAPAITATQILRDNSIACTGVIAVFNFGSLIEGNRIGSTIAGTHPGCPTGRLSTASGQRWTGNQFAFHGSTPVSLTNTLSGVVFRHNRISAVNAVPFDLNGDGFSLNDSGDGDTGANGLQNHPILSDSLILDEDHLQLSGSLDSTPNTRFALDFQASSELSRSALSGSVPLANAERLGTGSVLVSTDANGQASFGPIVMEFDGSGTMGVVSAQATRLDSNDIAIESSEFGPVRATYSAGNADLVVTNTATSGPGSLLRALLEAEARPDAGQRDRIVFAIPGSGPHTVSTGQLANPVLAGAIEIDGFSQPGATANASLGAIDAQLMIDIVGSRFSFGHPDTLVRGVVLRGPSALLSFAAGGAVEGSFVGVSVDGLSLASSASNTAQIACGGNCRVGGPSPAQRNLIGCPFLGGLRCLALNGPSATVQGNLIGVQRNGLVRLLTPTDTGGATVFTAVEVQNTGAQILDNTIGGFVRGLRLLSGLHQVHGNRIGVGVDDLTPIGNARHGIESSAGQTRISGNRIAHNGGDGVLVRNGSVVLTLVENQLAGNGGLGVDLDVSNSDQGDGVSANDPLDPDGGPNGGQNFPLLSQVRRQVDGVVAVVSLNSLPNQSFRIRYCYVQPDPSGHGECDQPIVGLTQTLNTDANGNASAPTPLLPSTTLSHLVATAAIPIANSNHELSSEFGPAVRIADPSSTSITAHTPDPAVFGQSISVVVSVASSAGTPAGQVTIGSSSGGACVAVLSAGSGSCELTPAAAGLLTLSAVYEGSDFFAPSSASLAHQVNPAATVTQITADTPDPSTFGDAITVAFQVQSSVPVGGAVQVSDGTAQCQGKLGPDGAGSCVLTPTTGGALVLTASFGGDGNLGASSDTEDHTVNAVATSLLIVDHGPNPSVSGQLVNVSAALTTAVGDPAGPIVVSDGAGASCQIADAAGSCGLIPVNSGSIHLRADYAGSPTHLASSDTANQTIERAATALVAAEATDDNGQPPREFAPMRFAVAVDVLAPGAGVASGSITVTGTPGIEVCVINLPALSCDLVVQAAGPRQFELGYAGDARFLPASASLQAHVRPDGLHANGFEDP